MKAAGIYLRVSSNGQSTQSQEPDLNRWADSYPGPVKWYADKATGKTMDRPGWRRLEEDLRAGKLSKLVCWRLDRLGRTARELLSLRDELRQRKVDLVCVMSGVMGLESPEGRLMFDVIAAFAEFEREVRRERQAAGIAVAKQRGKYRGRKPGTFKAKPSRARRLQEKGLSMDEIATALNVTRMTVWRYLKGP
jgi:DNA invertase Pin-like site-specific DNA recombinase